MNQTSSTPRCIHLLSAKSLYIKHVKSVKFAVCGVCLQRKYIKFSLFEYSRDKKQEAISLLRKSNLFQASMLYKIRTFSPIPGSFPGPSFWYFLGWFWLFFDSIFVRFMSHLHTCTFMIWSQPVILCLQNVPNTSF